MFVTGAHCGVLVDLELGSCPGMTPGKCSCQPLTAVLILPHTPAVCPLQERIRTTRFPFLASLVACWGTVSPPPSLYEAFIARPHANCSVYCQVYRNMADGIGQSPQGTSSVPRHLGGTSVLQSPLCQVLVPPAGCPCWYFWLRLS